MFFFKLIRLRRLASYYYYQWR